MKIFVRLTLVLVLLSLSTSIALADAPVSPSIDIKVNWSSGDDTIKIEVLDMPNLVRAWYVDSNGYDETLALPKQKLKKSYPHKTIKGFSLFNSMSRTYFRTTWSSEICSKGPEFSFSKTNNELTIKAKTTTGNIQVMVQNGDDYGPEGVFGEGGGSVEFASYEEWGSIEFRLGNPNGLSCAKVTWDFRVTPEPFIMNIQGGSGKALVILGDNLFSIPRGPSDIFKMTIILAGNNSSKMYSLFEIRKLNGSWDWNKIEFPIPHGLPSGEYTVQVRVFGQKSNEATTQVLAPFFIFVPNIFQ